VSEKNNLNSRREFLRRAGGLLLASGVGIPQALQAKPAMPNPVGYAAISWPRNEFDTALSDISSLGLHGVQMLGWTEKAYRDKIETLKERLNTLKLKPAALSCSGVSPNPVRIGNDTSQFKRYASFMGRLGGKNLQITDGGHPWVKYSSGEIKALGARMNDLGKLTQDFGMVMGYHPHFGTLGETRKGLGSVLDATDPQYVKLIADVAHLMLGGSDPAEVIRTYHDRLIFLHFKDVRKDVLAQARKDRNQVQRSRFPYLFCEIGQGAVNFPAILQALRKAKIDGWVIIELDAYQLRPGGPVVSARMNRDAMRKMGFSV
jgi:inosose dehydratase